LIGKTTVHKKLTLMRGFQYKDKEGNELLNRKGYNVERLRLMRGPTVVQI